MPMYNPSHPGELIRDSLEVEDWTVTECAARLGVARHTLSAAERTRRRLACNGAGTTWLE